MRVAVRLGIALGVFGLVTAGCTGSAPPPAVAPLSSSVAPSADAAAVPAGEGLAVVPAVAARVEPGVVTILTGGGNGSGVVYAADGVIVTNEHVVRGNTTVQVAFADGQRVNGTVQAADAVTDVALVRADRRDVPPSGSSPRYPWWGAWRWSSAARWGSRTASPPG